VCVCVCVCVCACLCACVFARWRARVFVNLFLRVPTTTFYTVLYTPPLQKCNTLLLQPTAKM